MTAKLVGELDAQRRREEFQNAMEEKARAYARAVRAQCDRLEQHDAWRDMAETEARLDAALRERDEARKQKDGAYAERNQCVALLARMANRMPMPGWRAWVARHPDLDTDWEDDWRTIVFVEMGAAGQATWHFHDSEAGCLRPCSSAGPWVALSKRSLSRDR